MSVCRVEDEFTNEQKMSSARWIVTLSDDGIVIQDDGRYGPADSAWLRLKSFCEQEKLHIVHMYLQFRSHYEHLPSNMDSYYFAKGIIGHWGSEKSIHTYNIGAFNLPTEEFTIQSWRVPELITYQTSQRYFEKCQDFLISK